MLDGTNIRYLQTAPSSELTAELLRLPDKAFEDKIDFPIRADSTCGYLADLVSVSPRSVRRKLRGAVVNALSQWRIEQHGIPALEELAHLVPEFKAKEAIQPLVEIVDQKRPGKPNSRKAESAYEEIIYEMGGFIPNPQVKEAFQRWFNDNSMYPYAGQLLNGLVAFDPDQYTQYLPTFLRVAQQHPKSFNRDAVLANMLNIVNTHRLAQHLHELPVPALKDFLKALSTGRFLREQVSLNPSRLALVTSRGRIFLTKPETPEQLDHLKSAFSAIQ